MRYIALGMCIIIAGLLVYEGYNRYMGITKADVKVIGVRDKYFAGGIIDFDVLISNNSETEKCFLLSTSLKLKRKMLKFPDTFMVLVSGEKKQKEYLNLIPPASEAGEAGVVVELREKTVDGEKVLVKKTVPFNVNRKPVVRKPVPLEGTVKFAALPEKIKFSEKLIANTLVRNTSSREGSFIIKVGIRPSGGGEADALVRETNLGPNTRKLLKFEHRLEQGRPDGRYLLDAVLLEKDGEKVLASDSSEVKVVDTAPEIVFEDMGLLVRKGKETVYKVNVKDDRGVKEVRYFKQDLKKNDTTSYMMTLVSGSRTDGVWSYSTGIIRKRHKFKFYISALDIKGQESKTEEYTVAVMKK